MSSSFFSFPLAPPMHGPLLDTVCALREMFACITDSFDNASPVRFAHAIVGHVEQINTLFIIINHASSPSRSRRRSCLRVLGPRARIHSLLSVFKKKKKKNPNVCTGIDGVFDSNDSLLSILNTYKTSCRVTISSDTRFCVVAFPQPTESVAPVPILNCNAICRNVSACVLSPIFYTSIRARHSVLRVRRTETCRLQRGGLREQE